MHVLITAATPFEIAPLEAHLQANFRTIGPGKYQAEQLVIQLLITGVGLPSTAFSMGHILAQHTFALAINAGIAGAFTTDLAIGSVVEVVTERFGDLGVEEADGSFTDVHQLGLVDPQVFPFQQGQLVNPQQDEHHFLPKVNGLSVNKVHGHPASIAKIREKYSVEVESMEGAAFFYACLLTQTPFFEIRSISNYVEARNRENWDLPLAIERLNEVLIGMVTEMVKH